MNASIRILKTPYPFWQWSFQLFPGDNSRLELLVRHLDASGGWEEPFSIQIQNHLGERQKIDLLPSKSAQVTFSILPYIQFSSKPPRQDWKIPAFVFQTWRVGPRSPHLQKALASFENQKGYFYTLWDDDRCVQFLYTTFGERYANAFNLLVPGAYRADFWRYCVLYKFGGVYADAKTTLLRPLDEIIRPEDELVLVRDIPKHCLLNGFIACRPEHPFLKHAIEICLERIEARNYGNDPLDITGPSVFARAFCRWLGHTEGSMTLDMGYTNTFQVLGRSSDKKYIISPEGEVLLQKDYDEYYTEDIDTKLHYPKLWGIRAVFADAPPWNIPPRPEPPAQSLKEVSSPEGQEQ